MYKYYKVAKKLDWLNHLGSENNSSRGVSTNLSNVSMFLK